MAHAAIDQIRKTCEREVFTALAYCVMPDHVHLVVEGLTVTSDLRRYAKLTKQRIEYVARKEFQGLREYPFCGHYHP